MQDKYIRRIIIESVYDADTITATVDQGMDMWIARQKFRLYGINAPEVRGKERTEGLKSRDWLRERLEGQEVSIQTRKSRNKGKYGRWLATLFVDGVNLNEEMVSLGLAKEYMKD